MLKSRGLLIKITTALLFAAALTFASVSYIQNVPGQIGFADYILDCPENECRIEDNEEEEPPVVKTCPANPVLTTASSAYANVGKDADKITFTFKVTNNDITTAKGVEILSVVPKTLEVVNFSTSKGLITHNSNSNNVKATLPVLKPGETITVIVTAKLSSTAQANMTYYVGSRVRYGNDCETKQFWSNWLPFYPMGG